jgi:sigma-B regulation protein RsbU (phosphoserine phosphatase)
VEFLIPHRYRGRHREYIASYREAPRTRPMGTGIEIWALRKDGSEFPAEISLGPLETEEGLLILSAHRDITERKRLEQSLRERDAQLLAAQRIQERLLPEAAPVVRGFDIFGACYPAEFAAGDHFDYLTLWDDSLGIVVGDVVGHGMGPALVMTMTHAHLRSLAGIGAGIDEILLRANRMLVEETEPDIFVTMLFVRLDPHARSLTYASAGHPTAFILDGRGEVKAILPSLSLPLGIMPDTRFPVSDPIGVEAGDVILMFTDGLIEAASSAGVPFGESGMLEVLRRHSREPARKITEALYQTVLEYSGDRKLVDDVTLVVIKVEPPA